MNLLEAINIQENNLNCGLLEVTNIAGEKKHEEILKLDGIEVGAYIFIKPLVKTAAGLKKFFTEKSMNKNLPEFGGKLESKIEYEIKVIPKDIAKLLVIEDGMVDWENPTNKKIFEMLNTSRSLVVDDYWAKIINGKVRDMQRMIDPPIIPDQQPLKPDDGSHAKDPRGNEQIRLFNKSESDGKRKENPSMNESDMTAKTSKGSNQKEERLVEMER